MAEKHDPFLQALNRYVEAVRAKDVTAFLAIYDDDLHVFDMWGKWVLRGKEAWREMAARWFASLGDEQVVVSYKDASSTVTEDLAVGHAILTYTAVGSDGKVLRSLDNRLTAALRKAGGNWTIFHEHTSAPVDHATLKVTLHHDTAG